MHSSDLEGEFLLFQGNARKYTNVYRPQHEVHENYQTSGIHTYIGREFVDGGETVKVSVRLITPEVYPHCLWNERELRVLEGSKHVGTLRVTQVLNPVLLVKPGEYKCRWEVPPGLDTKEPRGRQDG